MEPHPGKVLAEVFGWRPANVCLKLQQLLAPFGITTSSTDGWGASERPLHAEQPQGGKEHTQPMESQDRNRRTRITRVVGRTLCGSQTEPMHALVRGLFINRSACGRCLCAGIHTCETSSGAELHGRSYRRARMKRSANRTSAGTVEGRFKRGS